MFTAKIENSLGEVLTLTQNEYNWQVAEITGLNPPAAQINLTALAGQDGAVFNSSKLDTRNIVIMLRLRGDVEANRQLLYRFFRTKDACTFYFSNNNRDVFIRGRVETCEVNLFEYGQMMQISIICPQPYFRGIEQTSTELSSVVGAFTFPFSINIGSPIPFSVYDVTRETNIRNDAESETGAEIELYFTGSVSTIEIKNESTGDSLKLQYNFLDGDRLFINTNLGEKSVQLLRDGVQSNLFSAVKKGSVFFQLQSGDNVFAYLADDGANNMNVYITMIVREAFRGV